MTTNAAPQPARPTRPGMVLLWRLVRDGAIIYAGILVLLLLFENTLVFQPSRAEHSWEAPPPGVRVEDVELTSADGTPLHAWWTAPEGWLSAQGAVLFCHGNGGNLSHRGQFLVPLMEKTKAAVLIFDYPGCGKSGGSPTEAGSYAAGEAAYDWLTQDKGIAADRIILFGGSLGTGVAVKLATERPHRALVLVSAYTSIPDMAQKQFPWLPARWLVRTRFNNLERIGHCRAPILIMHGPGDTLIPFSQGQQLFEAAPEPKQFFSMPNYGHLDFPNPESYPALKAFLEKY